MTVGELIEELKRYPAHVQVGLVMHSVGVPWGDVMLLT
jgi:hypothetical protein